MPSCKACQEWFPYPSNPSAQEEEHLYCPHCRGYEPKGRDVTEEYNLDKERDYAIT